MFDGRGGVAKSFRKPAAQRLDHGGDQRVVMNRMAERVDEFATKRRSHLDRLTIAAGQDREIDALIDRLRRQPLKLRNEFIDLSQRAASRRFNGRPAASLVVIELTRLG